jgi:hypothetical protein
LEDLEDFWEFHKGKFTDGKELVLAFREETW